MKPLDRPNPPRRTPPAPTTPRRGPGQTFTLRTSERHPDDLDRATDGLMVEFELLAFEGHPDDAD